MNSEQTSNFRRSGRVKLFGWAGLCLLGGGFLIGAFQDEIDEKFDDIPVPTDGFYRFSLGEKSFVIPMQYLLFPKILNSPLNGDFLMYLEIHDGKIVILKSADHRGVYRFDHLKRYRNRDKAGQHALIVSRFKSANGNLGSKFRKRMRELADYSALFEISTKEYKFGTSVMVRTNSTMERYVNPLHEKSLTYLFKCPGLQPGSITSKACLGSVSDIQLGLSYEIFFDQKSLTYIPSVFYQIRKRIEEFSSNSAFH